MRYISYLKNTPIFTTLQILNKRLENYPLELKLRTDGIIFWMEGINKRNKRKAIILANNVNLFLVNLNDNSEIVSIADPVSADGLKEYIKSMFDEYEFFYPKETLSLIGCSVL